MAQGDNLQRFTDTILQGMQPNIARQRKGMFDFLLQMAQRQGTSGALQQIQQGLQPFAEEAGQAAARAGVKAAEFAKQQEQFDAQQAFAQQQAQQQQANFEQQFAAQQQQQNIANLLAAQQAGGQSFSPELIDALGFAPNTFGQGGINAGFNRPNPALQRLGQQGSNFSMFRGGGAAPRSSSLMNPRDPFPRVGVRGQGGQGVGLQPLKPT